VVVRHADQRRSWSEPISWVLLTNLPVKDFAGAAEKVQWYGKRWGIETRHKVLKSGCKVEDCLLEKAERLKPYLTLFSIIGVRLMHVTYLWRACSPRRRPPRCSPPRRSKHCTFASTRRCPRRSPRRCAPTNRPWA